MKAIVVYESMFGSTEEIAQAIGEGLAPRAVVEVVNVDDAPTDLAGADLLVVGGPTHVHGMSRASTRQSAQQQAAESVRSHTGIRDWLGSLPHAPAGVRAVAFDTRLDKPRWLVGSAARGAQKLLRRHGYPVLAKPGSFFVTGSGQQGLAPGEKDRAREWARSLTAKTVTHT